MKDILTKLDDFKTYISKGDVDIVIKDLDDFLKDLNVNQIEKKKKIQRNYFVLAAQHKSLHKRGLLGMSKYDETWILMNNLTNSLLELIDNVEEIVKYSKSNKDNDHNVSDSDIEQPTELKFWNEKDKTFSKAFAKNYLGNYQNFAILSQINLSSECIKFIHDRIIENKGVHNKHIWVDENQTDTFNLIYVNTSVLYFFIQLGYDLNSPICRSSVDYLDSIKEISIVNRAKWYFDIQTIRISDRDSWRFISLLEKMQLKNGAFKPFRQGEIITDKPLPTHYGGLSFHACLVADVLLHLTPHYEISREKATSVLNGIGSFLKRMSDAESGYILDGNHERNAQYTTWYFVLCKRLGFSLPLNWESIILEILSREDSSLFKSSFLSMNLSLILIEYRQEIQVSTYREIVEYFEVIYNRINECLMQDDEISNRDLSIYGRALLYANMALGNNMANIFIHCNHK